MSARLSFTVQAAIWRSALSSHPPSVEVNHHGWSKDEASKTHKMTNIICTNYVNCLTFDTELFSPKQTGKLDGIILFHFQEHTTKVLKPLLN